MVDKNNNPPTTHAVKDGELLFDIAKAQYGDGNQWKKIADANGLKKPVDRNPGRVFRAGRRHGPADLSAPAFVTVKSFIQPTSWKLCLESLLRSSRHFQ